MDGEICSRNREESVALKNQAPRQADTVPLARRPCVGPNFSPPILAGVTGPVSLHSGGAGSGLTRLGPH